MVTYVKPTQISELVIAETNELMTRKDVTVASGAGLLAVGAVLGKITASGKYTISNASKTDGSQTPAGILLANIDATSTDTIAPVLIYDGVVRGNKLAWDASFDATKKATAIASLEANQRIFVKDSI